MCSPLFHCGSLPDEQVVLPYVYLASCPRLGSLSSHESREPSSGLWSLATAIHTKDSNCASKILVRTTFMQ
ncbi:hypothetical protein VTK26DRAFT_7526 [Humicola hyalothermophila]